MQTLTVRLENRIYHSFQYLAQLVGKTPEEITAQWVKVAVEQIKRPQTNLSAESGVDEFPEYDGQAEETMSGDADPLLALAGTLEYEATDLGEQHDEFIRKALLTELQGNNDE